MPRRADNDYGFNWLPRITGDHSHQGYWLDMADGRLEGLFVFGQNPAVGAPNSRLERRALAQLDWLVVRDLVEIETASFWYDSPEVERGELRPEDIKTEVFLMPAAGHVEKEGCFTNTQRLVQWREKAIEPPGEARSDAWFVFHLGRLLREKAARDPRPRNAGLNALTWNYTTEGPARTSRMSRRCCRRSMADAWRTERWCPDSPSSQNDGSTACGCWIYSGVYPVAGTQSRERTRAARLPWARLGICLAGRSPHSLQPRVGETGRVSVERAQEAGVVGCGGRRWGGLDVPDYIATKHPDYAPPPARAVTMR